jgi:hypothetical protein
MPVTVLDPRLRAGWEPNTPVSDSLLRAFQLNWIASIESQGVPLGARCLRRDDFAAVDLGRSSLGANVATLLAPLFAQDVEEIAAALDDFYHFSAGGCAGTVFLFSFWPTPDLRPHGWTLAEHSPLMLRPVGGVVPACPPGLRIEEVRDEQSLHAFELAMVRGFSATELAALEPGEIFSPGMREDPRQRLWVGWEGDRPVSAAAAFVAEGMTNVHLAATVPEARRRGYGEALTWRATLADPTLPALLIATGEGRPMYERMGYLSLFRLTLWERDR